MTPWEGALTNWEISAPVIVTKENKDSYFNLANAKGWTPFDTQTAIEGAAWYDKPLLQRGGVMPMLVTKLEKGQKGYVFCRTTLTTEASAKAQLQVGGSPSMHVYCNGELVWSQTGAHGYHPNADRVEVSLKKGKNEFVVCTNFVAFLNLPMPEIQ